MFDQIVAQLAIVAVFVQRVIDLVKPLYQEYEFQDIIDRALAILISITLCWAWGLNLLDAAGLHVYPLVGEVVTGTVAALGSSVLNQVLTLLKMLKDKNIPTEY